MDVLVTFCTISHLPHHCLKNPNTQFKKNCVAKRDNLNLHVCSNLYPCS